MTKKGYKQTKEHREKISENWLHKPNCPCYICKSTRGEVGGKNNSMYGKKGKNHPGYIHGNSNDRIHSIWGSMKTRCLCPNYRDYYKYGGRGIGICEKWKNSFVAFRDWAYQTGYKDNLIIHRKDNNLRYFPENCEWLTKSEHMRWHAQLRKSQKS